MKVGGLFFIVLGVFGLYALYKLTDNQSFLKSGYGQNRQVIEASEDPTGFRHNKAIALGFSLVCFGIGAYLIHRK